MAFLSMSQLVVAMLVAFVSVRVATLGPRSHTDAVAYRMANGTLPTPLASNDLIQQFAQQHFKGEIVAPEHFAFHPNGDIYFGEWLSLGCAAAAAFFAMALHTDNS